MTVAKMMAPTSTIETVTIVRPLKVSRMRRRRLVRGVGSFTVCNIVAFGAMGCVELCAAVCGCVGLRAVCALVRAVAALNVIFVAHTICPESSCC